MKPRRQAAFFDLDKTVIAKSSTLAFGKQLYRGGLVTRSMLVKGAYAQIVYLLVGADEKKMERMREALLELTRGWEREKVERLVREALAEIVDPIVYQEALDLIALHRNQGRAVCILSSSPEEIVKPLAEYLGVDHAIGSRAEVEDGAYTGRLTFYCYGANKVDAMKAVARRDRLDLEGSYAYSDSITDLPMLEAVGHPTAVNPDKDLREVAEERDWEILEFHRPVNLRARLAQLPKPPPKVVAASVGVTLLAAAGWFVARPRVQERAARKRQT
ncbi:MAG: HAD-IB family hydrolase [Actinomycetota bacterium]